MNPYDELHPENMDDQCPDCLREYSRCKCEWPEELDGVDNKFYRKEDWDRTDYDIERGIPGRVE